MKTCVWCDNETHCQQAATQHIVTSASVLLAENWYYCDEHADIIIRGMADSPFTDVSWMAYRITD
jgi:hypothetical protein